MSTTAAPPSSSIINLAIADLAIYAALLGPTVWITWKHGKAGMVVWPIFVSYFGLRFATDVYQVVNRHKPLEFNQVANMTNAGSLACLSLLLIGMVYEANIILPMPPKSWQAKILLGATHLTNTIGIGMATYGGGPDDDNVGEVENKMLNKIGNCLMLIVMIALCAWIWPTYQRLISFPAHPNFKAARWLLVAVAAGLPFHLIRLAYNTTYAFKRIPSLDPITGTFLTRFFLLFMPQLGVSLTAIAGGWLSMNIIPKLQMQDFDLSLEPHCSSPSDAAVESGADSTRPVCAK